MYYHLIDGDLASNFLSWQWVAGTSINKRYTVNQKLINGCSDHKQVRSILTYDREEMTTLPTPELLLAYEDEQLQTVYPTVDPVMTVSGATVQLYTPWTLNPAWRRNESDRRILVIDPLWFDRYPVSEPVLDFIIRQGKIVIPDLEVHVGRVEDIHGISDALTVHTLLHQTNRTWPVEFDQVEKLFPAVSGYYKSFFAYWKEVEKKR
jgi:deoxyribodipyrimidine photo-lyase